MEMARDLICVVSAALASPFDEHIKAKIGIFFDKISNVKKNVTLLCAQNLREYYTMLPWHHSFGPPPLSNKNTINNRPRGYGNREDV